MATQNKTVKVGDLTMPDLIPDKRKKLSKKVRSLDRPLTDMQLRFVQFLVHHKLSHSAAARQAGYRNPGVEASVMLKNPKIQRAIAIEREEYAKASGMTKAKVIEGFQEAIDMARLKADPMAMVSGWREVGKMCGFYEPTKTEITVSVTGQVLVEKLQNMTDEELLALAEQDIDALEGDYRVEEE